MDYREFRQPVLKALNSRKYITAHLPREIENLISKAYDCLIDLNPTLPQAQAYIDLFAETLVTGCLEGIRGQLMFNAALEAGRKTLAEESADERALRRFLASLHEREG